MEENGISNPYKLLTELDCIFQLVTSGELIESNSTSIYSNYLDELYKHGMDKEKLQEAAETYKQYVETIPYGDEQILIFGPSYETYDMVEPEYISEYLNNIDILRKR